MTAIENFKKKYPDVGLKVQYRGDGTVILDISKNGKNVLKALNRDEMETFFKLMSVSEQSANDFLYVTIVRAMKGLDDEKN